MKTKTLGSTVYIVKKYFTNANGELDCIWSTWHKKAYAFKDCEKWRKVWGEDSACVFKAKQCIEVGE